MKKSVATAYHEAGHAIVAEILPGTDPVHKVTIMPRGWALGVTWQLPEQDQTSHYKDKMLNELSILFGGRIAEEIFINQCQQGASMTLNVQPKWHANGHQIWYIRCAWCHGL